MLDYWNSGNANTLDRMRVVGNRSRATLQFATETDCTAAGCGWDEFTQSALKPDCTVCNGKGKTITWKSTQIFARVVWSNVSLNYVAPTPGVELGDVTLGIGSKDVDSIQEVMDNERSYVLVDGRTVKPFKTPELNQIPGVGESYLVGCKLFTPTAA